MQLELRHVALPTALGLGAPRCVVSTLLGRTTKQSTKVVSCPDAVHHASLSLHPNHQLPFQLSRCAASEVISTLRGHSVPVVFSGRREDALRAHKTCLTLSHEAFLGAAVGWCGAAAPPSTFALDIVDVADIARLNGRFPQFRRRWLSPCRVPFGSECDSIINTGLTDSVTLAVLAEDFLIDVCGHINCDAGSVPHWWQVFTTCPRYAANSVALGQHWSLRECCVKLLGLPYRAFNYGDITTTNNHCDVGDGNAAAASTTTLPPGLLTPSVVYTCSVVGAEREVMLSCGREPVMRLVSWIEWVHELEDAPDVPTPVGNGMRPPGPIWPYIVTVASCRNVT